MNFRSFWKMWQSDYSCYFTESDLINIYIHIKIRWDSVSADNIKGLIRNIIIIICSLSFHYFLIFSDWTIHQKIITESSIMKIIISYGPNKIFLHTLTETAEFLFRLQTSCKQLDEDKLHISMFNATEWSCVPAGRPGAWWECASLPRPLLLHLCAGEAGV